MSLVASGRVAAKLAQVVLGIFLPKLSERILDLALLPFQEVDLLGALLPAQMECPVVAGARIVRNQRLNLTQREPKPLGAQDQRDSVTVGFGKEPRRAITAGGWGNPAFLEKHGSERHPPLPRTPQQRAIKPPGGAA